MNKHVPAIPANQSTAQPATNCVVLDVGPGYTHTIEVTTEHGEIVLQDVVDEADRAMVVTTIAMPTAEALTLGWAIVVAALARGTAL